MDTDIIIVTTEREREMEKRNECGLGSQLGFALSLWDNGPRSTLTPPLLPPPTTLYSPTCFISLSYPSSFHFKICYRFILPICFLPQVLKSVSLFSLKLKKRMKLKVEHCRRIILDQERASSVFELKITLENLLFCSF